MAAGSSTGPMDLLLKVTIPIAVTVTLFTGYRAWQYTARMHANEVEYEAVKETAAWLTEPNIDYGDRTPLEAFAAARARRDAPPFLDYVQSLETGAIRARVTTVDLDEGRRREHEVQMDVPLETVAQILRDVRADYAGTVIVESVQVEVTGTSNAHPATDHGTTIRFIETITAAEDDES